MALNTTQALFRSGGGDQTRTAVCGSMRMSAPFYIANVAATGNVTCSSTSNAAVVLPAGSVVTAVIINTTGTGNIDLGYTPLVSVGPGQKTTLGTPDPTGLLVAKSSAARSSTGVGGTGAGVDIGAVANATNLVVVTSAANGVASGSTSGWIEYFVADPLAGQQNV